MIAVQKEAFPLAGWVSLPPTDHKADWDDYRQQNGLEVATAALNNSLYLPQGDGMNAVPEAAEGGKITARDSDPLKPRIESREDGIFWISPKVDRESGEIINNESWLCSPLDAVGIGRGDNDQYLILRWQASGAKLPTTQAIPLADIGEREGWRVLKSGGVNVTTKPAMRATCPFAEYPIE